MEEAKIDRINALAKKARAEGLTEAETAERAALRREYIDAVKGSLERQLDNTYIMDEWGGKRKLRKKNGGEQLFSGRGGAQSGGYGSAQSNEYGGAQSNEHGRTQSGRYGGAQSSGQKEE